MEDVKKFIVLSIITVVKNDCERLNKTIDSLTVYHSNSHFEHIIIDGKSSDETVDLLEKLKLKKNIRILSESDNGIYDAMNKGIRLANGQYLLFLNAGDTMKADVAQVYRWLKELPLNPSIICFPVLIRDGAKTTPLLPSAFIRHRLPTSHQGMIFSSNFFLLNSFSSEYKVAGDFDLYLKAKEVDVFFYQAAEFLTEVELDGYASENPTLAYAEYLIIAYRRLTGFSRILTLGRIFIWALIVIPSKRFLPRCIISALRNI